MFSVPSDQMRVTDKGASDSDSGPPGDPLAPGRDGDTLGKVPLLNLVGGVGYMRGPWFKPQSGEGCDRAVVLRVGSMQDTVVWGTLPPGPPLTHQP